MKRAAKQTAPVGKGYGAENTTRLSDMRVQPTIGAFEKEEQYLYGKPQYAQIIRTQRKLKGMTKTELAASVRISSRTLEYYEAGHRRPKRANAVNIANELGISADDLLPAKTAAK